MFKTIILSAALASALAMPAWAGSGGCDDKDAWTKSEADINAMAAGPEKDAAMADWKMASQAKASNNMNECDSKMKSANDHMSKGNKG